MSPELQEALSNLTVQIIYIATPVLVALVGLLLKKLFDFLSTKAKGEKEKVAIAKVDDALLRALQYTSSVFASSLKEQGKLDKGAAEVAMKMTMDAFFSYMDKNGQKEIDFILGTDKAKQEEALKIRAEALLEVENQKKKAGSL